MKNKITALIFDLTKENLKANQEYSIHMTSGINVLSDIVQVCNGKFLDSPFVYQIEMTSTESDGHVETEQMCNVLGIDKNALCSYNFYSHSFKQSRLYSKNLNSAGPGGFVLLVNKGMFKDKAPIFEIRFNIQGTWSSWQAIAGKFIVTLNYKFGPGGVADVYSSMNTSDISKFKSDFEIRYCGELISNMSLADMLNRVYNDPLNKDIRKIIDPTTYQILFDSQIIHGISSEDSYKIWLDFEKKYR